MSTKETIASAKLAFKEQIKEETKALHTKKGARERLITKHDELVDFNTILNNLITAADGTKYFCQTHNYAIQPHKLEQTIKTDDGEILHVKMKPVDNQFSMLDLSICDGKLAINYNKMSKQIAELIDANYVIKLKYINAAGLQHIPITVGETFELKPEYYSDKHIEIQIYSVDKLYITSVQACEGTCAHISPCKTYVVESGECKTKKQLKSISEIDEDIATLDAEIEGHVVKIQGIKTCMSTF